MRFTRYPAQLAAHMEKIHAGHEGPAGGQCAECELYIMPSTLPRVTVDEELRLAALDVLENADLDSAPRAFLRLERALVARPLSRHVPDE